VRPALFSELAAVTGGRSFLVDDPSRLESQIADLARELRSQYLIGYTPSRPAGDAPGWRSIQVTVSRREARVRARDGYVAR
jgi:Ca-activated chloride channel family protein